MVWLQEGLLGGSSPSITERRPEKESGEMLKQACSEKVWDLMEHLSRDFSIWLQSEKKNERLIYPQMQLDKM